MTKFTTTYGPVEIPSTYYDISVKDYESIRTNADDYAFVFSVLTSLTVDQVQTLDLSPMIPFIDFLGESPFDMEPLDLIEINETIISDVDVWRKTWGQHIEAEKAIDNIVKLVAIYTQPILTGQPFDPDNLEEIEKQIEVLPVAVVFPFALHIQKQLIDIAEIKSKLIEPVITAEQIEAGISEFDKLGVFNTIDMIAGGDVLKYDAVLEIPYSTIFNKLLLSNINSKFDKRLGEVLRRKSRPIGS